MAKFQPKVSSFELDRAMESIDGSVELAIETRARLASNPYSGKYAKLFANLYKDIYAAVYAIRREFEDGFQIGDLDDIAIVAAPALMALYRKIGDEGIKDAELEQFMNDLVMFMYYELRDLVRWGWMKWILKLVFKWYAAKKLGSLLAQVVRYLDGKLDATQVDERVIGIAQGVRNWLNGVSI